MTAAFNGIVRQLRKAGAWSEGLVPAQREAGAGKSETDRTTEEKLTSTR
jgi:hypothetical protein